MAPESRSLPLSLIHIYNVDVLNEDILKVNISKLAEEKNNGKPIKVVANLPYYITTPIIMGLFESHVLIDSITIMVQKEVADRMQEGPGSKEYGALSLEMCIRDRTWRVSYHMVGRAAF